MPKRIGILTAGGDAPGLNAVIRAAAKTMLRRGVCVLGIEDGFEGLIEGRARELSYDDVSGILSRGGTILGTSNRGDPLRRIGDGLRSCRRWKLDGLLSLGGEGTHFVANEFAKRGLRVIGVPKTIDNDVAETDITFGFDSAVAVAGGAVEALHSTADAHRRIMVVEVMGRRAGWIALAAGVAGGADVILIPERPFDLGRVADYIRERHQTRRFTIVIVAEGAGSGAGIGGQLEALTGTQTRVTVLGHLQRGGPPTAFDLLLATRFGFAAAECALEGRFGRMVALRGGKVTDVPLSKVAGRSKSVPRDHELIRAAQAVGTCLG
jgi:6-phosphofructokinase 1